MLVIKKLRAAASMIPYADVIIKTQIFGNAETFVRNAEMATREHISFVTLHKAIRNETVQHIPQVTVKIVIARGLLSSSASSLRILLSKYYQHVTEND